MKATKKDVEKIWDDENIESKWKGDNFVQGVLILMKYIDPQKEDIVTGAEHDEVYSVEIDVLLKKNITIEDLTKLKMLNWSYSRSEEGLSCFV